MLDSEVDCFRLGSTSSVMLIGVRSFGCTSGVHQRPQSREFPFAVCVGSESLSDLPQSKWSLEVRYPPWRIDQLRPSIVPHSFDGIFFREIFLRKVLFKTVGEIQ